VIFIPANRNCVGGLNRLVFMGESYTFKATRIRYKKFTDSRGVSMQKDERGETRKARGGGVKAIKRTSLV
jgi:hypothetical protein